MTEKAKQAEMASPMANLLKAMEGAQFSGMPQSDWMEKMTQMGTEMMSFITARVEQDVQTQQELMQAKGLDEVQHIQEKFFQKAMDDYAAETAKLMELGKTATASDRPDTKKSD